MSPGSPRPSAGSSHGPCLMGGPEPEPSGGKPLGSCRCPRRTNGGEQSGVPRAAEAVIPGRVGPGAEAQRSAPQVAPAEPVSEPARPPGGRDREADQGMGPAGRPRPDRDNPARHAGEPTRGRLQLRRLPSEPDRHREPGHRRRSPVPTRVELAAVYRATDRRCGQGLGRDPADRRDGRCGRGASLPPSPQVPSGTRRVVGSRGAAESSGGRASGGRELRTDRSR